MSADGSNEFPGLTPRSDEAWDRFEHAWGRGERPHIEEYLAGFEAAERHALLAGLLASDIEHRIRRGERTEPREYLDRFPDEAPLIRSSFDEAPAALGGEGDDPESFPGDRARQFWDYELERELGRGGMGVVYQARQVSLNRPVALKLIKHGDFASDEQQLQFQNEAEAVARLDHPNIVPIYEVGRHDGRRYFSMKLIAGESLAKRLNDYIADPRRTARLVSVVARAIHHAHQRGILHRDLKPANVLIDTSGQPHVTDFGLAKRIDSDSLETCSGTLVGTPAYMAAEQASSKWGAVTTSTDVHGLGAILYALLTGRAPFGGATPLDTLDQVREKPPEPPTKLNPRVPRDLELICLKCLEKDPALRFNSAGAMAEELERWLDGNALTIRRVTAREMVTKWARRQPALAAFTAALVATVILGLAGVLWQWRWAVYYKHVAQYEKQGALAEAELFKQSAEDANKQKAQVQRMGSGLALDRGLHLCNGGEFGEGALWLARALNLCPDDDRQARDDLRLYLGAWRSHINPLKAVLPRTDNPDQVAVSPGGRFLATATYDSVVQAWDAAKGSPVGSPGRYPARISSMTLDPEGKRLAILGDDKAVQLWDTASGKPIGRPITDPAGFDRPAIAFNADGSRLVTLYSDQSARLWDTTDASPVGPLLTHKPKAAVVAISPDGLSVVATGNDGIAGEWNAERGSPDDGPLTQDGRIMAIAFSPNGRLVATAGDDGAARIWDYGFGFYGPKVLYHYWWAWDFDFSPDSASVVTTDGSTARVVRTSDGTRIGKPLEHESPIHTVAFNPNGKVVAIASGMAVYLWDASTGEPVGKPIVHPDVVLSASFSPDGNAIVTVSRDKSARLWKTADSSLIGRPMTHNLPIRWAVLSPDGQTLGTVEEGDETTDVCEARLWNTRDGTPVGKPLSHKKKVYDLIFSPNSKVALTTSLDGTVRLWKVSDGSAVGEPMQHRAIPDAAFNSDGRFLLTRDNMENTVRLWVINENVGVAVLGEPQVFPDKVHAVAFSPAPSVTAVASGNAVTLFRLDVEAGYQWKWTRFGGMFHDREVHAIAFSPDGKTLATGSDDGTARLWSTRDSSPVSRPLVHPNPVRHLVFSPDGKTLGTRTGGGAARFWRVPDGAAIEPAQTRSRAVIALAFSPDGNTLATAGSDQMSEFWDLKGPCYWNTSWGVEEHTALRQPIAHPRGVTITSFAFSPDGRAIVTTGSDQAARLFSAINGEPLGKPFGQKEQVRAAAFSPDGEFVATACADGSARLWKATDGSAFGKPLSHPGEVKVVRFSPDGKTLTTLCTDKAARLWDVSKRAALGAPMVHPDHVQIVAFSPDGTHLATACNDRIVRLWSARDGSPVGKPMPHDAPVSAVAFSRDGTMLMTVDDNGISRIWLPSDGTLRVGPFNQPRGWVRDVAFSPDGKLLATAGDDDTVRLWSALDGKPVGRPIRPRGFEEVRFSPDGKRLITGKSGGEGRLWRVDGSLIAPLYVPENPRYQFSPDGSILAILSDRKDRNTYFYNTADGSRAEDRLARGKVGTTVKAIAFSPNGKFIATADPDKVARILGADGSPIGAPIPLESETPVLRFSPDGTILGIDDGVTRLRRVADGSPIGQPLLGSLKAFVTGPEGTMVVTSDRKGIARLWRTALGFPQTHRLISPEGVWRKSVSPDGRTLATVGSRDPAHKTVRLWKTSDRSPIGQPLIHSAEVDELTFSPNSQTLATRAGKIVRLWRVDDGTPIGHPLVHPAKVHEMTFSPDSRTLATGEARTVRLWGTADGAAVGRPMIHETQVFGVNFSVDGRRLLTDEFRDARHRLWSAADGSPLGQLIWQDSPPRLGLGGEWLAETDGPFVGFWKATTGSSLNRLLSHSSVTTFRLSGDGKFLSTASKDGTVRLWSAVDGSPVGKPMVHRNPVVSIHFSPDRSVLATVCDDHTAWLWRSTDGMPIGRLGSISIADAASPLVFSPAGNFIAGRSRDDGLQFWSTRDGTPVGPPIRHGAPDDPDDPLNFADFEFCAGGVRFVAKEGGTLSFWEAPQAMAGDTQRIRLQVEVDTGLELPEHGVMVHELDGQAWQERLR
jgi:WD40 repeat protein/predicted Ser/Thr protein kinase